MYGRRPVLIMISFIPLIPGLFLVCYAYIPGFSLWFFLGGKMLFQLVMTQGTSIAYTADLMLPENRAAATGLLLATLSIAIMTTPAAGAAAGGHVRSLFTAVMIGSALGFLYTVFFLPESLPREHADPARTARVVGGRRRKSARRIAQVYSVG